MSMSNYPRIRDLREDKDLTQKQIAEILDFSAQGVHIFCTEGGCGPCLRIKVTVVTLLQAERDVYVQAQTARRAAFEPQIICFHHISEQR